MSSILAKVGLTASASLLSSHCLSGIASIQPLARYFHSSQFWYNDSAARNAKKRERYASDPEFRNRLLQRRRERYANPDVREKTRKTNIKRRAESRPEHVQNYLNDAKYRGSLKYERTRSDASREREYAEFRENVNNRYQKFALYRWILQGSWQRRLCWETHEPLVTERYETPALCASCDRLFTRRLWWRRKKTDEKSAGKSVEESSEKILDCHDCFCEMDWGKAFPLGYRGHVFGGGKRLKQPDWANYPPPLPSSSPSTTDRLVQAS